MSGQDDDSHAQTDDSNAEADDSGPILDFDIDRRTALKGSAAGLAALGLGGLGTGSAAAGHNANKVAAAGNSMTALRVDSDPGKRVSKIGTLLGPLDVKTARDPKQALSFQPTIETSLFTRTEVEKSPDDDDQSDTSQAEAGVLGWIEVNGDATGGNDKIVTVGGDLVAAPEDASDLIPDDNSTGFVDDGSEEIIKEKYQAAVVAFDTRTYQMEWTWEPQDDDEEEVDEEEMAAHMRTRSANGFGWIAPLQGENSIKLRGVTYVYENDTGDDANAEAVAFVGNRTLMIDPIKLHHDVQ